MKPNLTIDEMAMKHLLSHKNDKSGHWLARMNGRFGRGAANDALKRNRSILEICGAVEKQPEPVFLKPNPAQRYHVADATTYAIQGFSPKFAVLNELNELV